MQTEYDYDDVSVFFDLSKQPSYSDEIEYVQSPKSYETLIMEASISQEDLHDKVVSEIAIKQNFDSSTCVFSANQSLNYSYSTKKNGRVQYNYHKKKKRAIIKIMTADVEGLKVTLKKEKSRSIAVPFSRSEDVKLLKMILIIGPKFNKVAKKFNGKTTSMVKNRYYKNLRYRWHEILGSEYAHLNTLPLPIDQ